MNVNNCEGSVDTVAPVITNTSGVFYTAVVFTPLYNEIMEMYGITANIKVSSPNPKVFDKSRQLAVGTYILHYTVVDIAGNELAVLSKKTYLQVGS